jgi:nicotinate-nucleotide adenylyltransferase
MRYIIFGGAFDPVHTDHLNKCKQVLDITGYDQLLFMPTYEHIWGKKTASPVHRMAMLNEALSDFADPRIQSSLFEVACRIKGPTIDTLKMLFESEGYKDISPNNTAYLIGMDQALVMDAWERWEELINLVPFIVMSRRSEPVEEILRGNCDWFLKPPHQYIKVTGIGVSSSNIRQDIEDGIINPDHLTPSTLTYIKEHELYV